MPDPLVRMSDTWVLQLEKADSRVNYRMVDATAGQSCGNCRYFNSGEMECNLVEGLISATCGCDLWTAQLGAPAGSWMAGEGRDHPFSVFVEVKDFGEAKENWIPFLPKPGTFHHPLYGTINVTSETNQAMVDSVKNNVYQEHIPIDAEHETKISGAMAWIKDMRLNADGSADAYVEWTPRGRKLVDDGQFKYVSPEWFDDWRDPGTDVVHRNVVAGGAITTRPFFKEKVLRALVANEDGGTIIKKEDTQVPDPKTYAEGSPELKALIDAAAADAAATAKTAAEADVQKKIDDAVAEAKKTTEPAADVKDFTESQQYKEMTQQLEDTKKANEALAMSLTEIKNRERHQRFSELVAGRGGANDGGAWIGDATKHVAFLEKLADQVGETNEMFTEFVENQNAAAAQAATAELYAEVGTTGRPTGGSSTDDKLEQLTKARMAADPKITHAKAYSEVLSSPEGAALYQAGEAAKLKARQA